MSAEQAVVQRSKTSSRSSRSLNLEIQVQAVDFLPDQPGTLVDFAMTEHYVAAQFKDKDSLIAYRFYDDSGKVVEPPQSPNGFTWKDLGKLAERRGKNFVVTFMSSANFDTYALGDALSPMGYNSDQMKILSQRAQDILGRTKIRTGDVLRTVGTIFDLSSTIKSDSSLRAFGFGSGEELVVFVTQTEDGSILAPEKWEVLHFEDSSKLSPDVMGRFPFLRQFSKTANAVPMKGTDIGIDQERGVLNLYDLKVNQKVYSTASVGCAIDPVDETKLHFLDPDSKRFNTIDVSKVNGTTGKHVPVEGRVLQVPGEFKHFCLGPQGNFLFVLTQEDGQGKIYAVERESLEIASEIPASGSFFEIDKSGTIVFQDENGKLRQARTNVKTFEAGQLGKARSSERDALLALHDRVTELTLPPAVARSLKQNPDALDAENLLQSLAERLDTELAPKIHNAKTLEALESLESQVSRLRDEDPDFRGFPEAFDRVEESIRQKKNQLRIDELQETVDALMETLSGVNSLEQMIPLADQFSKLARLRRDTLIADSSLRKGIDGQIRNLQEMRESKLETLEASIAPELKRILGTLSEMVEGAINEKELDLVGESADVEDYRKITSLLSSAEERATWRAQLKEVFLERRLLIRQEQQMAAIEEREAVADTILEIRELREEVEREAKAETSDGFGLDKFLRDDPTVQRMRTLLASLPDDFRRVEEGEFERWVSTTKEDFKKRSSVEEDTDDGRTHVIFDKHAFPKYQPAPINWVPRVIQENVGDSEGKLVFEDNYGRTFSPTEIKVPASLSHEATAAEVQKHWRAAEEFFAESPRRVPDYNPRWIINGHNIPTLDKISRRAAFQLGKEYGGHGRGGILILEGEAGAGKNVNFDIWAHFAAMELYEVACNANTEKEDVTYAWEYHPQTGTVRVNSGLLDAVQRPGTVVNLDEVNALQPGVAKLFNSALDYRRRFYLPDGRVVPIHPSVVIFGTMNPQYYLGVDRLSPEIKTRANIIEVGYPDLKRGNRFTGYEATILKSEREALSGLSQAEFEKAFHYVVNGDQGNGAAAFISDKIAEEIRKIHLLTRIASAVRTVYDRYHSGQSSDPIDTVFSIRETTNIAFELDDHKTVQAAVKDVLLPKADTHEEKKVLETIIDGV